MEQTQNISDERLAEIVSGVESLRPCDIADNLEIDVMARELTALRARCEAAEKREADLIVSDASMVEALCKYRASHKRLVEALEAAIELFELDEDAQTPSADAFTWTYHAKDALAEARILEGK